LSFGVVTGELSRLPELPIYEALRARLDANVDFERFVSEQRLREAELRVAESRHHRRELFARLRCRFWCSMQCGNPARHFAPMKCH
jgi:hypothetical protein